MTRFLLVASCLLAASMASAQVAPSSPAYQECANLASSDPAAALAKADAWLKMDASIAAQHCRAMALFGLHRFAEAGDALAAIRDNLSRENPSMRSYLARQSAQAFASANQIDRAMVILSAQIDDLSNTRGDNASLAKMTSEVLLDRAQLAASYGKLDDAAKDLDHAVSLTPLNDGVLAARAGVFEKLGDTALAKADAGNALKLNANNAAAKELLTRLGALPAPSVNLAVPAVGTQETTPSLAPAAGPASASRKKPLRKKPLAHKPVAAAAPAVNRAPQ